MQLGQFRKSNVRSLKFFRKIMQGRLIIAFQVMFHIDEDFNISRK